MVGSLPSMNTCAPPSVRLDGVKRDQRARECDRGVVAADVVARHGAAVVIGQRGRAIAPSTPE